MPAEAPVRAGRLLARSVRLLVRPPYLTLLAVSLFTSFVTGYVGWEDAAGFGASIVLWVITAYLQIAVILAAAAGAPHEMPTAVAPTPGRPQSAESWLRAAFGRRCFVRYFVTDLFVLFLIALALGLFVIPGFILGGVVALAPVAAVLEYRGPGGALSRSLELTRPARRGIGAIFGLCVLVPNIASVAFVLLRDSNEGNDAPAIAIRMGVVALGLVATIALAKAFLALGGSVTPRSARPASLGPTGRG